MIGHYIGKAEFWGTQATKTAENQGPGQLWVSQWGWGEQRTLRRRRHHLDSEVAGEKPRKVRSKAPVTGILPVRRAGQEDVPKPVRNTHRTQDPLTRRVPSRRRPQRLCAQSRVVVEGAGTARSDWRPWQLKAQPLCAGRGLLLRVLRFWARLLTASGAGDLGSRSLPAAGTSGSLPWALRERKKPRIQASPVLPVIQSSMADFSLLLPGGNTSFLRSPAGRVLALKTSALSIYAGTGEGRPLGRE
uniref:uncharacterized protein LOC125406838 n=1 Tax=Myodes glareolus TaxID=447135 RepID=UPI00201FD66B|nr:uncharacterized protein LOC125406838 [Myodes glareolus]